jgi:PAS domain S-box-containing protein
VVHTLGKIVFANPAAFEKMGARSADDLLGKNAIEFVHPDYRATALARIKNIYENQEPAGLAHEKFIRLDGQVIDVETTAIPFVYDGKPAIQLIVRDITDKMRMEQEIADSELKFRTLFESSHDALFLMTGEKFTECNQTTLAMFGCTRNEILNHTPFDFSPVIQPDGTPSEIIGLRYIKSVLEGSNQAFEWLHLRRDGTSFDAEVMLNRIVIAGKKYIQASVRDISQRKADEDKLRKSEARYRLLSDNMTDMVWLMDLNLVPLYVSPSIEKVRGFAFEELKQLKLEDNLTPESLDRLLKIYHAELPKVLSDVNYVYDQPIDLEYYNKDGTTFWLEILFSIIRSETGYPESVLCVGRDITEYKRTQEKLKESEKQLKFIANLLPVSIAKIDRDQKYLFVNQSYCEMMQKDSSEIIGRHVSEVLMPEAYKYVMPHIETVLSGTRTGFDLVADLSGSGIRIFSVIYVPELDPEGNIKGFIATITDITDRKQTEQKVQQQLDELKRWQLVTLGREDRIMELKREVNDLLLRLNEPLKYKSQENKLTDT